MRSKAVLPYVKASLFDNLYLGAKILILIIVVFITAKYLSGLVINMMYSPDFVPVKTKRDKDMTLKIHEEFQRNKDILSNRVIDLSYRNVPYDPSDRTLNPESSTKAIYDKRDPTGAALISLFPGIGHNNYTFVHVNGMAMRGVDIAALSTENHDYGTAEGLHPNLFRITAPRPDNAILAELATRNTQVISAGLPLARFTIHLDRRLPPGDVIERRSFPNSTYIFANRTDAIGSFNENSLPTIGVQ
jgi:hypothetical protein